MSEDELVELDDKLREQEEELERQMDEIQFSYYRHTRIDRFGCRKNLVVQILEKISPEYDKAVIREFLEGTGVLDGGEQGWIKHLKRLLDAIRESASRRKNSL
jgi:hypothetical protein